MKPIMNPTQLSSFSEETTLETWLRYWLCELVDNALAAARPGEKAQVQILLAEHPSDPQRLRMLVADWGSGMDLDGLRNCLQLGSHPLSAHRMHEHGFGIINALSSLSGNSAPWMLATRADPACPYSAPSIIRTEQSSTIMAGLMVGHWLPAK